MANTQTDTQGRRVAAVAIGRNEGGRLEACLDSLNGEADPIVYVDSGSTDGSVASAAARGASVVNLDLSEPFTAARARNAGFRAISERGARPPDYIQFVDGDCALVDGWLERAVAFLDANPEAALACGRRRERRPDASLFNRLCDIEWATPVGEAKSSGGDFLIRREAFESVGGFNPALIAGEEPDLCYRLRRRGWKIWRLDAEMTLHDAAMTRIDQWWNRTLRAGYAYANAYALHGDGDERFRRREVARAVAFGGVLPAATIIGGFLVHPAFFAGIFVYGLQIVRTYAKRSDIGDGRLAYAAACAFGKIPEFLGVLKFWRANAAGRQAPLIEYK